MALTFSISTASTTNAATYATGSFTPAAGDLLVVLVCATGTVGAGTCTESLGETTFTKITTALKAASADTLYAFVSNQPLTTSGARTVTFGTGGGNASGAVVSVYRVSGQSRFGAASVRQSAIQSNQSAAGTPAPTFANAVLTGNPTFGIVGNATNAATMTPPTSWTEDSDNGYATPTTGQESVSRASGFTGTTVTWGSTSASAFGDIVLEIDTSTLQTDDEDTSSWGGSFLNRVISKGVSALALSASIFTASLGLQVANSPQDDPAGSLNGPTAAYNSSAPQIFPVLRLSSPSYSIRYAGDTEDLPPTSPPANLQDEDYWQNEVAPVQASLFQKLPLGDRDEIPAGSLFGQYDEDFWQSCVFPVQSTLFRSPVFLDQDEIPAGSLFGQYDEDFWRKPVAPVAANVYRSPLFTDPEEIPAGSLFGQADEDLWRNPVAPVSGTFFQPLPYGFDAGEIVPQPVAPVPGDEDFWQNPVFPVQASLFRSPLFSDPEEIPAGSLFGQPDEDFWRNSVAPVPASNLWPQQWAFDVQEPAGSLSGQPDEDFWQNPIFPAQASLFQRLPLGDPEEIPVGSLFGQADEDFWINPVRPVPAAQYRSPILGDAEELPAGALLSGQPDEDFWINPIRPVPASLFQNLPYFFEPVDFTPTVQPIEDEDFWQNPVLPVAASLYRSPLFADPEEVPAGSLAKFVSPDEDYWQNRVAPVTAGLYRSTLFSDPEEVPAGSLFGQADEDFWPQALFPAPVRSSLYQSLPLFVDPDFVLPPSPASEDYWQNPVAPVAAGIYLSPVFRDPEEIPAGALLKSQSVEEYYWQNPVPPVAASLYRSPLFQDPDEIPAGSLVQNVDVIAQQPGGSLPAKGRRRNRPYSATVPEVPAAVVAAFAKPFPLEAHVEIGTATASGLATATADSPGPVLLELGSVTAKGIRNPTDEELIAILLAT